jgi:hypothetical protein
VNKFRTSLEDMPKPAQPATMQDFAAADREARLPKIQRQDALAAKQLKALKDG